MRHGALAAIAAILILFASQAAGQQPLHRVGFLGAAVIPEAEQAFVEVLRTRGYILGQNLQIDFRHSEGQNERIPALVAELVALGPEVIVASSPQNSIAVHTAAPAIPLVFMAVADPIGLGLVKSLAHPGGTATGFASLVPEGFGGKQLEIVKTAVPEASRVAILMNPQNQMHVREQPKYLGFARQLGLELSLVEASEPDQYETAFKAAHNQGAQAIVVLGDALTFVHAAKIAEVAARYHMPAMYWLRRNVEVGGLLSWGPNTLAFWPRAAGYVDRILKGEKPADLPVEQPTEYDLYVNLKTARALGISIPPFILEQAKEVFE
jgi:putative ABC transport system substrate-binding protein